MSGCNPRKALLTHCALGLLLSYSMSAVADITPEEARAKQYQEAARQQTLNGVNGATPTYGGATQGYGGTGQNTGIPVKQLPPIKAAEKATSESTLEVNPFASVEKIREIVKGLEAVDEAKRAQANAVPVTSSQTLDMKPGSPPPMVRVAVFHGASVNFIDATGEPWPVAAVVNFNKTGFLIDTPYEGSSTVNISNLGKFDTCNFSVFLEGLATPVVIGVYGNQKETDYRKDFRLLLRKPGSKDPIPSSGTSSVPFDTKFNQFVDGIPPEGGIKLETSNPGVIAYEVGDVIAIRTQLTVLSAFNFKIPSADGTAVYVINKTPVITVSSDGKDQLVQIKL